MDDLVLQVVRELSFEGDLGEQFVLHLISDRLELRDSPSCADHGGSTLVVALFICPLTGSTPDLLNSLGVLGCNITRLEALIDAFYKTTSGQGVDGSFFAFAWSIILQEPSVYVGVLPPGNRSEVYVAPPPRTSKKDPTKTGEATDADQVATLERVEDGKSQALELLKRSFGERLRIAVDREDLRVTLAGPHARVCPEQFPLVSTADTFIVPNAIPNGLHGSATCRTRQGDRNKRSRPKQQDWV